MMRILCRAGLLGLTMVALACGGPRAAPPGGEAAPEATVEATTDRVTADLVVLGGTLVRRGAPDTVVDLALGQGDRGLVVLGDPAGGELAAADTIDASGFFIHTGSTFGTTPSVQPGRPALFLLRSGPGPGDPAVWFIAGEGWRRIEPGANRPDGPVDPRVGCYVIDWGEWSDPDALDDFSRVWLPDDVRLHWQHDMRLGRETLLAATDLRGRIPGRSISFHAWSPLPADSLRVSIGTGFQFVFFRLALEGDGYAGRATLLGDAVVLSAPPPPRAEVRFHRVTCPDEDPSRPTNGWTMEPPGSPAHRHPTGSWPEFIGDYAANGDTLIVRERDGVLEALIDGTYALTPTSSSTYRLSGAGAWDGHAVRFEIGEDGLGDVAWLDGRRFDRLRYGGEHGETFRIQPVRPVEELRRAALAATPPVEEGVFRTPELVDLATLDPAIRFDIRYATTNNFMGAVFYREPRAFLQRPAAEALLRAHRGLAREGLGLLVFDAYRPWFVTWMFFHATPVGQRVFVANPAHGSRHNRGAAVDVTLYDLATGRALPMPSGYDEFSPRAYPNYPGGTTEERHNRELLRRVMEAEGFAVYHAEWWHFDYREWRRYPILNVTFDELVQANALR